MVKKGDSASEAESEATDGADLDYAARLFAGSLDDVSSLLEALGGSARAFPGAMTELGYTEAKVWFKAMQRCFGASPPPELEPAPGDRRFADPAWRANPALRAIAESYLAGSKTARHLVKSAGGPADGRGRLAFVTELLLDALAPTNVPFLNPSVMKEALDTGGLSLLRGAGNFVDDLVRNGGQPRQVDAARRRAAGGHPRAGGDAQRARGAAGVRTADQARPRGADPRQPALDQQVLHHGSRP